MGLDSILPTPIVRPAPKPATPSAAPSSSSSSAASNSGSGATNGASASSTTGSAKNTGGNTGKPTSGKESATRSSGNNSKPGSTTSTQSKQSTSQTQSTGTAANGKSGAANQSAQSTGPSFLQALAQTQADAEDSANVTTGATPQAVTGNKSKAKGTGDSGSSSGSLTFIPQSLVAAMTGAQPPASQGPTAAATDNDSDSSTDGVSLSSGSSVQDIVANLTKATAEALDASATPTSDPKTNADVTTTSSADANSMAVSVFQAHMSVGSHFQQVTGTDAASNKVSATVGTPAFDDELGGKITWMANQRLQSASLQLSPEHLGPVEVRISVQDGSASVAFNANHADTRAALEQALPRLREMLSSQGLTLTDASVSQQSPRGQAQKQPVAAIGAAGAVSNDSTSSVTSVARVGLGLVDTYA